MAKKLPRRIMELKAFDSLGDVPSSKPYRRHKLLGNRKDFFAINVTDQYRIVFEPIVKSDDLKMIKEIKITEVSKHYE